MSYIAGNGITIQNDVISSKTISTKEIGSFKTDGTTIYIDNNNVIHAKKEQTITLSDYTLEIGAESTTVTVLGHKGDGALSVSSSDTSIVTASISGDTITITGVSSGNAVVTVSAAATSQYLAGSATIAVIVEAVDTAIYGAEWTVGSDPAWTRTDDAVSFTDPNPYYAGMSGSPSSPFDSISPWKDMQIVEDSAAGTLVEIPKFYYKWTRTSGPATMKLQISMTQHDGFLCSPAHADRGDNIGERDYVYVGRYHCASDYKSATGDKPIGSLPRADFRLYIHNLGANIWQEDFAMWWTVNMLYLVEFAHWNSQVKIGYGCGDGATSTRNMGYTDSMGYHTGTTQSSRTTYGLGTQYRYIEGWWDNVFDFVDGIYFSGTNIYGIKNPANFSDASGGTAIGTRSTTSTGGIAEWTNPYASGFEYALYPNIVYSNVNDGITYACDNCTYNSRGRVLYVGGTNYNQSLLYGAFRLNGDGSDSTNGYLLGSRLMVLPSSRLTPTT